MWTQKFYAISSRCRGEGEEAEVTCLPTVILKSLDLEGRAAKPTAQSPPSCCLPQALLLLFYDISYCPCPSNSPLS